MTMDRRLRLCFVCNEYPPGPHGGIGGVTQTLARALVRAGHDVRVIGVYPTGYPAPDYEEDCGVRVWRLRWPAGRFGWIRARKRLFAAVSRWTDDGDIDLVEVPDWEGWAAGWPRLSCPVVVRANGSSTYFAAELGGRASRVTRFLERAALRRADFWCSVSRYTVDRTRALFALPAAATAVLYNAVELPERVTACRRSRTDIVFAGTLTPKKGILSLADAWPRVLDACPEARLHVYGKDGRTVDGASVRRQIAERLGPAAETVEFHGHVDRASLAAAFARARAAVFPSYAEAFALVPAEAMACGCPTIYSRRGSGAELITDGIDGLLVDPARPGEIAAAIVRLLRDDRLAAALGHAGQARVHRELAVDSLLGSNEAFYRSCLDAFHGLGGTERTMEAAHA